jgi:hypothetical protein
MNEAPPPKTKWVTPEDLTDEQIADARQALENLIKIMARAAVDASMKLGIRFDMDDPEVARGVMKATFEGLFLQPATSRKRAASKRAKNPVG